MPLSEEKASLLVKKIQSGVPLSKRPFLEIGKDLELSEDEVLEQVQAWSNEGILREISAILEGSALGYESCLVAGKIPQERLLDVAKIVNAHPTVTHNYERNHEYNLWFTIASPLEKGLDYDLGILAKLCEVDSFFPLRRTLTYKIGVNFDLKSKKSNTAKQEIKKVAAIEISDSDKVFFRALQKPLPLVKEPFAEIAQEFGFNEDDYLAFANKHLGGAIRRYVATLRHRKLGVKGNGMAVWNVGTLPEEEKGFELAGAPEVSHCYSRNTMPGFDYSLYSMIHGPDEPSCREIAARLSNETGINDYIILFSSREFKKVRLRYFLPELDEWYSRYST